MPEHRQRIVSIEGAHEVQNLYMTDGMKVNRKTRTATNPRRRFAPGVR
jgi:hypothetical protein